MNDEDAGTKLFMYILVDSRLCIYLGYHAIIICGKSILINFINCGLTKLNTLGPFNLSPSMDK